MRYGDLFLEKIDVRNLPTMRNETKKQWIKNLDIVRARCEREQGQKEYGQDLITQYFQPLSH